MLITYPPPDDVLSHLTRAYPLSYFISWISWCLSSHRLEAQPVGLDYVSESKAPQTPSPSTLSEGGVASSGNIMVRSITRQDKHDIFLATPVVRHAYRLAVKGWPIAQSVLPYCDVKGSGSTDNSTSNTFTTLPPSGLSPTSSSSGNSSSTSSSSSSADGGSTIGSGDDSVAVYVPRMTESEFWQDYERKRLSRFPFAPAPPALLKQISLSNARRLSHSVPLPSSAVNSATNATNGSTALTDMEASARGMNQRTGDDVKRFSTDDVWGVASVVEALVRQGWRGRDKPLSQVSDPGVDLGREFEAYAQWGHDAFVVSAVTHMYLCIFMYIVRYAGSSYTCKDHRSSCLLCLYLSPSGLFQYSCRSS